MAHLLHNDTLDLVIVFMKKPVVAMPIKERNPRLVDRGLFMEVFF